MRFKVLRTTLDVGTHGRSATWRKDLNRTPDDAAICRLGLPLLEFVCSAPCRVGAPVFDGLIFMPKLKTHKATARRMQYSGAGKLMRTRQGKSHLRRNRSKRAARDYDEMHAVNGSDAARIRRLMPYAK